MTRRKFHFEIECHDGRVHERSLWLERPEDGFRILQGEAFPFGWKRVVMVQWMTIRLDLPFDYI